MVYYDMHLRWMDREVEKAMEAYEGMLAERQGVRDAKIYPFPIQKYEGKTQVRYEGGFQIGKAKLLQEVRHEGKCQNGRCGHDAGSQEAGASNRHENRY